MLSLERMLMGSVPGGRVMGIGRWGVRLVFGRPLRFGVLRGKGGGRGGLLFDSIFGLIAAFVRLDCFALRCVYSTCLDWS